MSKIFTFTDYIREVLGDVKAADSHPDTLLPLWDVYKEDYKNYCTEMDYEPEELPE